MARTAEVKRDARIGEADAKRDAQIKEAIAEEERMAARLLNDAEIAKAESVMVGEKLGAQIKEISSTEDRLKDLTDLE